MLGSDYQTLPEICPFTPPKEKRIIEFPHEKKKKKDYLSQVAREFSAHVTLRYDVKYS